MGEQGLPLTTTAAATDVPEGKEAKGSTPDGAKLLTGRSSAPPPTTKGSYRTLTRELIDKNKFNLTQLKEFDPQGLPENFAMVIYGIRRRGKSFLLKELIYQLRKRFDRAFLFSSTADLQPEQYSFVPTDNVYHSNNTERLTEIIEEQEEIIKSQVGKPKKDKFKSRTLIIFDDFIQDTKIARGNEALKGLYVRGRHCDISVVALVQSRTGISPMMRDNIDAVICFEATNDEDRKMLCKNYLSSSDFGYKEGTAFFNSVTETEYTALAINTTIKGQREVYQRGFSYKVPAKQPKFLVGKQKQIKNQLIKIDNIVPSSKNGVYGHSARIKEIRPETKMKTQRMDFNKKEVRSIVI